MVELLLGDTTINQKSFCVAQMVAEQWKIEVQVKLVLSVGQNKILAIFLL